tara:strand:- start:275 stop:418 length:144 start_codon:yes stop_codon:yes gene_type:complete
MKEDKRDKDCLPLPPTPTSNACPPGFLIMRAIRQQCLIASSNKTTKG